MQCSTFSNWNRLGIDSVFSEKSKHSLYEGSNTFDLGKSLSMTSTVTDINDDSVPINFENWFNLQNMSFLRFPFLL